MSKTIIRPTMSLWRTHSIELRSVNTLWYLKHCMETEVLSCRLKDIVQSCLFICFYSNYKWATRTQQLFYFFLEMFFLALFFLHSVTSSGSPCTEVIYFSCGGPFTPATFVLKLLRFRLLHCNVCYLRVMAKFLMKCDFNIF